MASTKLLQQNGLVPGYFGGYVIDEGVSVTLDRLESLIGRVKSGTHLGRSYDDLSIHEKLLCLEWGRRFSRDVRKLANCLDGHSSQKQRMKAVELFVKKEKGDLGRNPEAEKAILHQVNDILRWRKANSKRLR